MGKRTPEERAAEILNGRTGLMEPAGAKKPEPMDPEQQARIEEFSARRREATHLLEVSILALVGTIPDSVGAWNVRNYLPLDVLDIVDSVPLDEKQLVEFVGRCMQVARWKKVAGTIAERTADAERLEQAEAVLADRGPMIEAEINRLTAELDGLKRDKQQAATDVETRTSAVARLREFVPPHIKERHRRAVERISPLRRELSEARSEIETIRRLATIDIHTIEGISQATMAAESAGREDLLNRDLEFHRRINPDEWKKFVEGRQREIPAIETRIAELTSQTEHAEAEAADTFLDLYSQD